MAKKTTKSAPKKAAKKAVTKKRAAGKAATAKPPTKAELKRRALRKQIERRNAAFAKADAATKRVMIAQDVIEQIKARKILPDTGAWVELDTSPWGFWDAEPATAESTAVVDLAIADKMPKCSC